MRTAYLKALDELAEKDKNVIAIVSDNGIIVYDEFQEKHPEQFMNAGISEANMIGMAAGMANRGKIPFTYTIGTFMACRAYEFILSDVCLQNQNVKMIGIGAGISYSLLGSSHHSIFDFAILRPLPNLTIFSPATPLEVQKIVRIAYDINGPVYIRLGTNREPELYISDFEFQVGKGYVMREGRDAAVFSTGSILADVLEAVDRLKEDGISVRVINMPTIKPFDTEIVMNAASEVPVLFSVEEHSITGGLGGAVSEVLAENGSGTPLIRIGLAGFAEGYGKYEEVRHMNGIAAVDIYERIKERLG